MMRENLCISPNLREETYSEQASVSRQTGFTLIELLIVITILGVLMSIATGSWTSVRSTEQVRSAADKIRSAMTAARLKALATGESQCVGVDMANERVASSIWELDGQSFCVISGTAVSSWDSGAIWDSSKNVNFMDSLSAGEVPGTPNTAVKSFVFTARGTATNGSVLVKSSDASVDFGIVLIVNQVTGRVRMDECSYSGMSCQ